MERDGRRARLRRHRRAVAPWRNYHRLITLRTKYCRHTNTLNTLSRKGQPRCIAGEEFIPFLISKFHSGYR